MHSEWTDLLSPYLDGELTLAERRRVDAHLAGCPECGRVLADLQRVTAAAGRHRGIEPPRDLWPAIAARIEGSRVVELKPAGRPGSRVVRWIRLAVAAVLLVSAGIGGTLWWQARAPQAAATASDPPVMLAGRVIAAEAYDAAIVDLERALEENRGQLDSSTVRVVKESLRTIDRAIAEAKAAIQRDPSNAYLNDQIAANMRRKLAVLRTAARAASKET